ncbi:N-6 DNA methylase [Luteimonas dalianensis]|uniref:N-6 DNA methylase n=1 Tax=Luteimonas dalianensis TaxID=1148196 RepID=UPI003BF2A98D
MNRRSSNVAPNRSESVAEIIKAIERIPADSPATRLAAFTQHVLATVLAVHKAAGRPVFLALSDLVRFGFVPVDPDEPIEGMEKIEDTVRTYQLAVRNNPPFTDLLTPVHEHFASRRGMHLGQFFSTSSLADGVAGFVPLPEDETVKVLDLCCGIGALSLAYLRQCLAAGIALECIELLVQDIDPTCAALTALQLVTNQWLHINPLGKIEVQVGCVLGTSEVTALRSIHRSRNPATILAPLRKQGADLVLSNPPFGNAAAVAWERAMNDLKLKPREN